MPWHLPVTGNRIAGDGQISTAPFARMLSLCQSSIVLLTTFLFASNLVAQNTTTDARSPLSQAVVTIDAGNAFRDKVYLSIPIKARTSTDTQSLDFGIAAKEAFYLATQVFSKVDTTAFSSSNLAAAHIKPILVPDFITNLQSTFTSHIWTSLDFSESYIEMRSFFSLPWSGDPTPLKTENAKSKYPNGGIAILHFSVLDAKNLKQSFDLYLINHGNDEFILSTVIKSAGSKVILNETSSLTAQIKHAKWGQQTIPISGKSEATTQRPSQFGGEGIRRFIGRYGLFSTGGGVLILALIAGYALRKTWR